jgi:hypothetical protein
VKLYHLSVMGLIEGDEDVMYGSSILIDVVEDDGP